MYIDPGTGSMFIQGLIALIPILGATLIAFWRKIFKKQKNVQPEPIAVQPDMQLSNDGFEDIDDVHS
ncbi:MAG: hypothetical protein LBS72_07330 [Oscillospiraceae bacterium]|jgi:hypothetical protein|nr:hypothetical protein [Oscillospiraceae bacterium]